MKTVCFLLLWVATARAGPLTIACAPVEAWDVATCQITRTLAGDSATCTPVLPTLGRGQLPNCMSVCPIHVGADGDREAAQAQCTLQPSGRCDAGCAYDPGSYR